MAFCPTPPGCGVSTPTTGHPVAPPLRGRRGIFSEQAAYKLPSVYERTIETHIQIREANNPGEGLRVDGRG